MVCTMTRPGYFRRLSFPSICVVLFSLLAAASPSRAQSVSFAGSPSTIGSGIGFRRTGRRRSRMLSLMLLVAAGVTAAGALNGCGGDSTGYFGQAPATSRITVIGTSGSLNHIASVLLTVG